MDIYKLPNGINDFEKLITEDLIYVDKTDLIYSLTINNSQPLIFSRPNKFGKSLLVSTFEYLFKQRLDLFKNLKIEKLWHDRNTYKVIHLDFTCAKANNQSEFSKAFCDLLESQFKINGLNIERPKSNCPVTYYLNFIYQCKMNEVVLLIDEYDAPLINLMEDQKEFENVNKVINNFLSCLKSTSAKLRFLFITGVTRYSNSSILSGFNDYYDISLSPNYGSLLGFTEQEIDTYFGEYLNEIATKLSTSYEDVKANLKKNYDGYCFEETASIHVYNTWSVISFINGFNKNVSFPYKPYWSNTGAYSTLVMNFLKDISNLSKVKNCSYELLSKINELDANINLSFDDLMQASSLMEMDPRVLMYQAGYITIKKTFSNGARFGIPNLELQKYLYTNFYKKILQPILPSDNALLSLNQNFIDEALSEHLSENIIEIFSLIIKGIAYDTTIFTHENNLREFIYLALKWLGTDVQREVISGKGRADILIKTLRSYYVFELKLVKADENVDSKLCEAVNQIKDKDYGNETFKKNLYRYAVVISEKAHDIAKYQELEPIEIS